MTTERIKVGLTLQQAEAVEWALGPMADHFCTEDGSDARDGELYDEDRLPALRPHATRTTYRTLVLSDVDEINDDLIYRLSEQLPDMDRQSRGHFDGDGRRTDKAARNAVLRIRHAMKYA